jgi:hypothetical protein
MLRFEDAYVMRSTHDATYIFSSQDRLYHTSNYTRFPESMLGCESFDGESISSGAVGTLLVLLFRAMSAVGSKRQ